MTALSDLLRDANVDQLSTREIARRAEKNGHRLSLASASVYLGGRHGVPTEAVLEAFSDVLNIPIAQLRAAAGVPTGAGEPWSPPAEANRLDHRQRRALEELIRSMVASEAAREDQDDEQDQQQDPPGERADDPAEGGGVARPAVADGVTAGEPDFGLPVIPAPITKADLDLAAEHGVSKRVRMDAEAARRGEDSQDPEDWS